MVAPVLGMAAGHWWQSLHTMRHICELFQATAYSISAYRRTLYELKLPTGYYPDPVGYVSSGVWHELCGAQRRWQNCPKRFTCKPKHIYPRSYKKLSILPNWYILKMNTRYLWKLFQKFQYWSNHCHISLEWRILSFSLKSWQFRRTMSDWQGDMFDFARTTQFKHIYF